MGLAGDDAEAASAALYRLAAAQGLANALFLLGWIYYLGEGVAEDNAVALHWCKLAATQGHPTVALHWCKLAAAQGLPHALHWVAFFYHYGFGVAADTAEAICWYKRAHAAGDPRAAADLQQCRPDEGAGEDRGNWQ